MTVTKEIERLEHSAVKLTLTVDKNDVRSNYDKTIGEYAKSIQLPGFRRGKAPRDIILRKLGDALNGEVLSKAIEESLGQIFQDETFPKEDLPLPYAQPTLQEPAPTLDLEQDLTFSVVYDVLPVVTVGPWKGLEIEIPSVAITDEDINRELKAIQERLATVIDKAEGAPAVEGDVVTIDYEELSEAGEPLPDSQREDFTFTLGSGANIYRFDDEVLGMLKGESRDFDKVYPADFDNADLAGTTKRFRLKITSIKEKQLPEINDELAQDVNEKFQTLEELNADIRKNLNKDLERRVRQLKMSKLLEKIMETTPVDTPESMIRLELESRWRNLARQMGMTAEDLDRVYERGGSDVRNSIFDDWRPDVEKALKSRIIVETLIKDQGFEASDEEVESELASLAEETDTPLEDVKKYYEDETVKEYLKEDLKERKLFDLMFAENTINAGPEENYIDLATNNG